MLKRPVINTEPRIIAWLRCQDGVCPAHIEEFDRQRHRLKKRTLALAAEVAVKAAHTVAESG
jgi:hypothetical protein